MMRTIRTLIPLVLAAGLAVLPASAEYYVTEKNAKDPNRAVYWAFALEFEPIAKMFGVEFAWADAQSTSSIQLEFVPRGDDVRSWTRMLTINTLALPPKEAESLEVVKDLQTNILARYREKTNVLDMKEGTDPSGAPTLFVEYEIGDGAAREHNAAAIMKLRAGQASKRDGNLAGIVQIQSRGKPLAREDVEKMKAFAATGKQAAAAPAAKTTAALAVDKDTVLFEEVCVANIADLAATRNRAKKDKWSSLDANALKERDSRLGKPFMEGWRFEQDGKRYDVRLLTDTASAPSGTDDTTPKSFTRTACSLEAVAGTPDQALAHLRAKYGKEGVNLRSEGKQMVALLYWQVKGAGEAKPGDPWVFLSLPKPGDPASTRLEINLTTETRTEK